MKHKNLWPFYLIAAFLLLAAAALIFSNPWWLTEVPFQSIEISDTGGGFQASEPYLQVLSEKEDIFALGDTVSSRSKSALVDLDFNADFVVIVHQGLKTTSGYKVEILRITHQGNKVNIFVRFTERDPAQPALAVETSPYHVVKLSRQGLGGEHEFTVFADDKEIIRQVHMLL